MIMYKILERLVANSKQQTHIFETLYQAKGVPSSLYLFLWEKGKWMAVHVKFAP